MTDDLREPAGGNAPYQFSGAEGSLAGRTPDVYAIGFQHQHPAIAPGQGMSDAIVAHLVVGRHHDRIVHLRTTEGVESGWDHIIHPSDAPACLTGPQSVTEEEFGGYARDRPSSAFKPAQETGHIFIDFSATGGCGRPSAGWLVQTVNGVVVADGEVQFLIRLCGHPDSLDFHNISWQPISCNMQYYYSEIHHGSRSWQAHHSTVRAT